jgi:hypothetical protein
MPILQKKKKKVRKVKYRKVSFKLSEKQKLLIDRYCKVHKTSDNKMIKKAIKEFLARHVSEPENEYYISENQLRLFDEESE